MFGAKKGGRGSWWDDEVRFYYLSALQCGVLKQEGTRRMELQCCRFRFEVFKLSSCVLPLNQSLRIRKSLIERESTQPFINLCIYIALTAFQSRWRVGISFLVGLSLFFNIEALLHGGLLRESDRHQIASDRKEADFVSMCSLTVATALAADKLKFLRSLDRVMRQIRVAAIVNSFQAFCMIVMACVSCLFALLFEFELK